MHGTAEPALYGTPYSPCSSFRCAHSDSGRCSAHRTRDLMSSVSWLRSGQCHPSAYPTCSPTESPTGDSSGDYPTAPQGRAGRGGQMAPGKPPAPVWTLPRPAAALQALGGSHGGIALTGPCVLASSAWPLANAPSRPPSDRPGHGHRWILHTALDSRECQPTVRSRSTESQEEI